MPGVWNLEYAFFDHPAGQPEKFMFGMHGSAKVDRALRRMSAYIEDTSRKDAPQKVRFEMVMSTDAKRLDVTTSSSDGSTPTKAVFLKQ